MKVAGLNNLGFSKASPASSGKSTPSKEVTSFESFLSKNLKSETAPVRPDQNASKQQANNEKSESSKNQSQPEDKKAPLQETKVQKQEPKAEANNLKSSSPNTMTSQTPSSLPMQQNQLRDPVVAKAPESGMDSASEDMDPSESAESIAAPNGNPGMAAPVMSDHLQTTPINSNAALNLAKPGAAAMTQDDPTNSLTRRVVWNDFLRKMNDLGVSAEDVLQAFGSLSKEELAQPPEQSVDKVVMALGLDGQQAVMAKQYFNDLIGKTKSKSLGEELSASEKQLSVSLMSQRDVQRKAVQKSLVNMDHNFFMDRVPRHIQQQAQSQLGEQALGKDALGTASEQEGDDDISWLKNAGLGADKSALAKGLGEATPAVSGTPTASVMQDGSQMNKMVAQMKAPAASDKKSIDDLIRSFNSREAGATAQTADANATQANAARIIGGYNGAAPQAAPVQSATVDATAAPSRGNGMQTMAPATPALGGIWGKDNSKDTSSDDSGDDGSPASYLTGTAGASERLNGQNNVKGDFQSQLATGPQGAQSMSVPDIIQQAHVMVKDGGGEMKITLHPDGLGEVAMRVSVTDGKVNVQMITESDEAKKLIERGIGDLKNGLMNNHLQVDSIKVDTSTNLGKQLEQQYHDAQRQQAQANMEQFRQDHQGWRRSFFDTGSAGAYAGQGRATLDIENGHAGARTQSANSSRRLDLVA